MASDDFGTCFLTGCFGFVKWDQAGVMVETILDTSIEHKAGLCDNCGTLHVRCGSCAVVDTYESGTYSCEGCGAKWHISDHDDDGGGYIVTPISKKKRKPRAPFY